MRFSKFGQRIRRLMLLTGLVLSVFVACETNAETIARCGKGWLEKIDGQLVLHVEGSPREMGYQHGVLLKEHCQKNINYLVLEKGKELIPLGPIKVSPRGAIDMITKIQRKHVSKKFYDELEGLSEGSGIAIEDLVAGNFIPEMFHCSGFAIKGTATKDGTLYHGRVLDYACDWRLQEHAVVVVAKPDNGIPFVNITYAGFIGSVSGMNAKHISIGEMGGRGLGHWDGVPMALLMRQVLETAETLEDGVAVFEDNPRTCEYYYVIADGNTNRAVGMEANWKTVNTIGTGETHPRLPHAVPDAVLLSAGQRYEDLVTRVKEKHGEFAAPDALRLMDRPVAMNSNLHNVLFEPASTKFWVANASKDGRPAAEQPYFAYQLTDLLARKPDENAKEITKENAPAIVPEVEAAAAPSESKLQGEVRFVPADTEPQVPERFQMKPHSFSYTQEVTGNFMGGVIVSKVLFPSPMKTPYEANNTVHCEYFAPVGSGKHPGVVVLHILGGDFELSRVMCRSLAVSGTGALFVKMPFYGPRRVDKPKKIRMISVDQEQSVEGMTQAVLDIRRAATWLENREEIDGQRLGITGISLGGIVGALAASVEPRFQRACLLLSGGDLGKIILESEQLAKHRRDWKGPALSLEEVRAIMRPVDPLTYADRLRGREVLMMNGRLDRVIPPECTKALWEKAGKPPIVWWDADHYSAAKYLPSGLFRMAKFFRQTSGEEVRRQ